MKKNVSSTNKIVPEDISKKESLPIVVESEQIDICKIPVDVASRIHVLLLRRGFTGALEICLHNFFANNSFPKDEKQWIEFAESLER